MIHGITFERMIRVHRHVLYVVFDFAIFKIIVNIRKESGLGEVVVLRVFVNIIDLFLLRREVDIEEGLVLYYKNFTSQLERISLC
jgi:hypothetical protein